MRSPRRVSLAAPAVAALALILSACTAGDSSDDDGPSAGEKQTVTIWHGFNGDTEIKAFEKNIKAFEDAHENITVDAVSGQDDDAITQAIRGGKPPDVAVSFTTDNVGIFCESGAWQDLSPRLSQDKVDLDMFPKAVRDYTQFRGKRCALPMLADTYGLYYNKKLLNAAGFTDPPKTVSQLADMAKKLTRRSADGTIEVAGFMPNMQYYENSPSHWGPSWGATWFTGDEQSNIGTDPAWKDLLTWQKSLVDWYGYKNLESFRQGLGQEFSADNPFHAGKVAMTIDGEWRTAMIAENAPDLDYGTAPFPVADGHDDLYGAGYVTGTIMGIPRGAEHTDAAWELVKYLTTDTTALVTLANTIHNVPSTLPSLQSPELTDDPNFRTFVDIFGHPKTSTTPASPNGGAYQVSFQEFVYSWEAGKVTDLGAGLSKLDTEINNGLEQADN